LKWLLLNGEYACECPTLKVDRGITSENVIELPVELFVMRGVSRRIHSDNGPGFIAQRLRCFLLEK
jgi:putative transposase